MSSFGASMVFIRVSSRVSGIKVAACHRVHLSTMRKMMNFRINKVALDLLIEDVGKFNIRYAARTRLGPSSASAARMDDFGNLLENCLGHTKSCEKASRRVFRCMPPATVQFPK